MSVLNELDSELKSLHARALAHGRHNSPYLDTDVQPHGTPSEITSENLVFSGSPLRD